MSILVDLMLLATITLAALFDIKERRIPNWLILVGLISGIVLGALQGGTQIIFSLIGFFIGIITLIIPFAFGWIGAGDVKLFATVGALLGYTRLPRVLFYSCLVAGILGLVAIALGYVRQVSFKTFWVDCKSMLLTARIGVPNTRPTDARAYSVPWGVAIGAGTIMAYYFDPTGTWAGF